MRRYKQLRLAWLIFALLSLFISAQASATSYDCDGGQNPVPANVSGSAFITSSGVCTIGHNVTATGAIYILAGSIQAQGLQAGDFIQLDSSSGDVQVAGNLNAESFVWVGAHENIAINGDVTSTSNGSSRLRAGGNVSVNNITGSLNGHVIIETNFIQAGGPFYIGGTGNSNGINGTATSPFAVYVKNFSGDINVVDSSKIVAKAILLDASYGSNTIEIPSGTLSVSQYNDGTIQLLANTVNFASGAVLSAQNSDSSGHVHGIAISAENINYEGDGLTLNADGDGLNGADGFVYFLANGGTSIVLDDGSPYNPYIGINNVSELAAPINVSATDNAPLTLSVDGSYSTVLVQGYPVVFSGGGDINFKAKGESHNGVYFRNLTTSDMDGFSFTGGTGSVTVDVSGKNGNSGGTAEITGGVASFDKALVNIKANGTTGVDGNAGSIWINVTKLFLNNTETVVAANGSNNGNGGFIELHPGDEALPVGQGPGKVRFEAKGGDASGNAGQVKIAGAAGEVTVYGASATSTPVDVSVLGTTGDGGVIDIQANAGLAFDGEDTVIAANSGSTSGKGGRVLLDVSALTISLNTNTHVVANGAGTGIGGDINIKTQQNLSVANGVASLSLEARNYDPNQPGLNGNADGGTIQITADSGTVDLYAGAVTVDGGQKGGTLDVKALNLTLDGDFYADGGAQGDGGTISFEANSLTLPETENTLIRANGNGSGKGGNLSLTTHGQAITVNGDSQKISLEAKSNDFGDGGTVTIKSDSDVDLNGTFLDVSAGFGSGGKGGDLSIVTTGNITTTGEINVNGGCQNGDAGNVTLDGDVVSTLGEINANGAGGSSCVAIAALSARGLQSRVATPGTGNGGEITVKATENIDEWLIGPLTRLSADGSDSGKGGTIIVNKRRTAVNLTNLESYAITARGGESGKGGEVTISNAYALQGNKFAPIDVNKIIKVDGGASIGTNLSDGKITLNTKTCEQWKTGFVGAAVFPGTYWNCIDGNQSTGMPVAQAVFNKLEGNLRTILATPKSTSGSGETASVQIYVMPITDTYYQFFYGRLSPQLLTIGLSSPEVRVAAAFVNVKNYLSQEISAASNSGNPNVMNAAMLHELAHNLDYIWGRPSQNLAIEREIDFDELDQLPCLTVWSVNECTGTTLMNSEIFETVDDIRNFDGNDNYLPAGDWELFARVFTHRYTDDPLVGWQFSALLESVYDKLDAMYFSVQGLVQNPPPSVN